MKKDGKVIIRNLRKSYFANYPEKRIKSEGNQLAWFVCEQLGNNEELVDISKVISGEVQLDKLDVLAAAENKKIITYFFL